jgi:hypothetical protein
MIILLAVALGWRWHSQAWRKIDLFADASGGVAQPADEARTESVLAGD